VAFDGQIKVLDLRLQNPGDTRLLGQRFAVKDIFAIAGETTGFGNPDWLATHEPAESNAPVIDQLLNQGASLVAKSCSDEFALSLDGINEHYGTPHNTQLPDCIPGGSSSGSASMVASEMVDFALGTDTAGSIRVPASYCGICSLRPTFGAISVDGVLPLGPSFDTVGILAPNLYALAKVAACLITPTYIASSSHPFKNLIILQECFDLLDQALIPDMMAALMCISPYFKSTQSVQKLFPKKMLPGGLVEMVEKFSAIRGYEAWQCHGQWIEEVKPDMAESVKQRFLLCHDATESDAMAARVLQTEMQQFLTEKLNDDYVFCLPTTVNLPPLKSAGADELQKNRMSNMQLCSIASFAGLPQVTIPLPLTQLNIKSPSGRTISSGISLIAGKNHDLALLVAAASCSQTLKSDGDGNTGT